MRHPFARASRKAGLFPPPERVRRHHPAARQRTHHERPLDRERADERTILRRLAVVAAVDEARRAVTDVR